MDLAWQPIDTADDPDQWHRGNPADYYDLPDLSELLQRPSWHARAACRGEGPAKWFPTRGETTRPAVDACQGCPVRDECRSYALEDPSTDGIWAGTSKATRRAMRKTAA